MLFTPSCYKSIKIDIQVRRPNLYHFASIFCATYYCNLGELRHSLPNFDNARVKKGETPQKMEVIIGKEKKEKKFTTKMFSRILVELKEIRSYLSLA